MNLVYLHNHAPSSDQLASAAQQSARTLERLSTSYDEVTQAQESLTATGPTNFWQTLPEVKDHISAAWTAWPDLDSIERLRKVSDDVVPFLDQVNAMDIDFPRIYSAVLSVADNFASDEIVRVAADRAKGGDPHEGVAAALSGLPRGPCPFLVA